MPRVTIAEQPTYPFATDLEVRVADLNYGGHLGHDRILGLAQHARLRLLRELDASELDLGDGRTGIVAVDAAVRYLGEAFVHDVLTFEIRPVEIRRTSFRLAHRVVHKERGGTIALVELGFVGYDYERRRPAELPSDFRARLLTRAEASA
jgi:acyl-CoA thioesterase FadM